jgi:uncharacterized membrane-anchored protein
MNPLTTRIGRAAAASLVVLGLLGYNLVEAICHDERLVAVSMVILALFWVWITVREVRNKRSDP